MAHGVIVSIGLLAGAFGGIATIRLWLGPFRHYWRRRLVRLLSGESYPIVRIGSRADLIAFVARRRAEGNPAMVILDIESMEQELVAEMVKKAEQIDIVSR